MDKRIVIVTMASAMLLAGCTVGKKDNVQETGVELGSEVVENSDSTEVNDNSDVEGNVTESTNDNSKNDNTKNIKVINGEYKINKEDFYLEYKGTGPFIDEEDIISAGTDNICYVHMKERLKLKDEKEVDRRLLEEDLSEKERYELENIGCDILVKEGNCDNLCIYDDKVYYTTEDKKAYVVDIKNKDVKQIEELKAYDINQMYVISDSSICFLSGNTVYQYTFGEDNIVKIKEMDNLVRFTPTEYGILYEVTVKGQNVDVYANDNKVLENVLNCYTPNGLNKKVYKNNDKKTGMFYYDVPAKGENSIEIANMFSQ